MAKKSKVLRKPGDMPDTFSEGMSRQVTDEAHEQMQAASFEEQQKGLAQKQLELQMQHDVHKNPVDLQKERKMDSLSVDPSLSDFEKNRQKQKLFERRIEKNILAMRQATEQQIRLLQALQADFIAKSASAGRYEAASFSTQRAAVVDNANSLSSLISMTINDALNNAGKDKTHEESYFGTSSLLFSGEQGRQKSIVINGAIVTLDEDVAQVIQEMRSPIMSGKAAMRKHAAADGVSKETAKIVEKAAKDIVKEVERGQLEIEKQVAAMDKVQGQVEQDSYARMEQMMLQDRQESERAYAPVKTYDETAYNYDYENQTPYQRAMDPRPVRRLPDVKEEVYEREPQYTY